MFCTCTSRGWLSCTLVCAAVAFTLSVSSAETPKAPLTEKQQEKLKERDRLQAETDRLANAGKVCEAIATAGKMLAIEREVFGDGSEDVADSLNWLTSLHARNDDFAAARAAAEERLKVREKLHGREHWQSTNARLDLADIIRRTAMTAEERQLVIAGDQLLVEINSLDRRGKYRQALEKCEAAIEIRKKVLGESHRHYALGLFWRGLLNKKLGNYAKAAESLSRAEVIYRQVLGQEHPSRANTLNELASTLSAKGDYSGAEQMFREIIKMRQRMRGETTSDYATSLNNLAELYSNTGRYKLAEPLYLQALAIYKATLGEKHPYYANSLGRLGGVYQSRALYGKAEPLLRRSLEIHQAAYGKKHPLYAAGLFNLAGLYSDMHDYGRAEPLYREVADLRRELLGDKHPGYATVLARLGHVYKSRGDHARAEPLYRQSLEIVKQSLGEKHPSYARDMLGLADLCMQRRGYAEAESLYLQALDILERAFGRNNSESATCLNNLAHLYGEVEMPERSVPLYRRALAAAPETQGDKHPLHAVRLNNLAIALSEQARKQAERGDVSSARKSATEAIELLIRRWGPGSSRAADERRWLEYVEQQQKLSVQTRAELAEADRLMKEELRLAARREFRPAVPISEKALRIYQRHLGAEHWLTASAMHALGYVVGHTGEPLRYQDLTRQALAIRRKVLGNEHPDTTTSLHNLAVNLNEMGDPRQAVDLYRQAIAIKKKSPETRPLMLANTIASMAAAVDALGDFPQAEALYREALEIRKLAVGEDHAEYAGSLLTLGWLYLSVGDEARAEPMLRRAVAIYKDALGDRHPDYARSLDYLATCCSRRDDLKQAGVLYERALEIRKQVLGSKHGDVAISLNNLALLYNNRKEYAKAIATYEEALKIKRDLGADNSASYALALANLAYAYDAGGQPEKAGPLFRQSLEICRSRFGETHPDFLTHQFDLAWHEARFGDPILAEKLAGATLQASRNVFAQHSSGLSERQRLTFRGKIRARFELYLSLTADNKAAPEAIYPEVLAWKAPVSADQQALQRLRRSTGANTEALRLFDELEETTRLLAARSRATPDPAAPVPLSQELSDLTDKAERLQKALAAASRDYREARARQHRSTQDIRAALPKDSVLIDLVAYRRANRLSKEQVNGPLHLAAFIMRPDRGLVREELGPVKPIEEAMERWLIAAQRRFRLESDLQAGVEVKRMVWDSIARHVGDARTVLIAPSGALNRLPWAALPGKKPGSYLIEERAVVVTPVPQLLPEMLAPRPAGRAEMSSLLIVGGVDFDANLAATEAASTVALPAARAGELFKWAKLPGTVAEADAVGAAFRRRYPTAALRDLRGDKPSEAAVRQAIVQHRYLHFATHGYFAPPGLRSALTAVSGPGPSDARESSSQPNIAGFHPGLLSGLVLAGANRRPETERDDGVLTALEVESLDLGHVDLAVLSACETGLGDSAGGEGLLGLQRAFQIAGARSIVSGLWQVDDSATRKLMTEFYQNLWDKKLTKLEALRQAQLWLLREGDAWMLKEGIRRGMTDVRVPKERLAKEDGRLPPYFWAGFALSGDWR